MHRTINAELTADATAVFDVLTELGTYPDWLDLVTSVEPAAAHPDDDGPAWFVTLRAKVGPFARSKRLRMQQGQTNRPTAVEFVRAERDGRSHASWTLHAHIAETTPTTTDVTVELAYTGGLWTAPLEAILGDQVNNAVPRLQALVDGA